MQNKINKIIDPITGIRPNKIHGPFKFISCKRLIDAVITGMTKAKGNCINKIITNKELPLFDRNHIELNEKLNIKQKIRDKEQKATKSQYSEKDVLPSIEKYFSIKQTLIAFNIEHPI